MDLSHRNNASSAGPKSWLHTGSCCAVERRAGPGASALKAALITQAEGPCTWPLIACN